MAKGAEAIDVREAEGRNVNELKSDSQMGKEHSANVMNLEAAQMRKGMLDRMRNDKKGVISEKEKKGWQGKIDESNQDISQMRSVKDEFEDEWRKSLEMRKRFDKKVHGADESGMLRHGEHQKLDDSFLKSSLAEKERALKELESELGTRRKELNRFLKLEKSVQEKRRDTFKRAENYDEKIQIIESAEKENKNFQAYRNILKKHSKELSKKTIAEYLEWFLTLAENEQTAALRKVEKEDIEPRVKLFNTHKNLPKKYQESAFKEWGKSERERYLSDVEQRMDRDHRKLLRQDGKWFGKKDLKFCEQSFNEIKGDLGPRLERKAAFLDALPGHIKTAKKQWDEFEKFDPEVQDMLHDKFDESDFNERKHILGKEAPKLTERYTKALNQLNNKVDAHISEAMQGPFKKANTIEAKELIVKDALKFQKHKDGYFSDWEKNSKVFRSEKSVYERWYEENVNSPAEAEKARHDLKDMIKTRKTVQKAVDKLPPNLQERMNTEQSLSDRERDLTQMQEVAKHYVTVIPFLVKNAEQAEKEDDLDKALDFYLQALKMDPESPELKILVASLKQRGAEHSLTGSSKVDQDQTDRILKEVDGMHDITAEAEDLARNELLLQLSKKHREKVGASGSTTKARAQGSLKSLAKEDRDTAETLVDEHGDTHTVDETGVVRKKMKIKTSGDQVKETEDQLQQFFGERQHKGDVTQKGLSEVAFVNQSGQEMELDTAQKQFQERTSQLAAKREKNFLTLLDSDTKLTEKQLKAVKEAYHKTHKDEELVEEGIEHLKAA